MCELMRSNDTVFVSWLMAALRGEGIEAVLLDLHMSIVEGSISAIPRRVMVAEEDHRRALDILRALQAEVTAD